MPAVVDVWGMEGSIYSATQKSGSPYRNAQIEEALFQMSGFPLLIGASRRQITSVWTNRNLEGGYGCPVARRLFPQSDTVTFLIAVNEPLNITSASS
jgi:hypothetical protein